MALQPELTAAEGQQLANVTLKILQSQRSDDVFNTFWKQVLKKADEYDVGEPTLPRKRKMPKRFEEWKAAHEFPQTGKDLDRKRWRVRSDYQLHQQPIQPGQLSDIQTFAGTVT